MSNIYDGIESVEFREKLPYLSAGRYVLELEKLVAGKSKKTGVPFFKIQVRVLEAQGPEANPAGTSAVHVITKGKFDYHLRDIYGFVSALLAEPQSKVTGKVLSELTSEENPAAGTKIRAEVSLKEGTRFTNVRYSSFEVAPMNTPAAAKTAKKSATA